MFACMYIIQHTEICIALHCCVVELAHAFPNDVTYTCAISILGSFSSG